MKIRIGFVSNSSSSSFVINLNDITAEQLYKIKNHFEVARSMPGSHYQCASCYHTYLPEEIKTLDIDVCAQMIDGIICGGDLYYNQGVLLHYNTEGDAWDIIVDKEKNTVSGATIVDNFSMENFLRKIGVPSDVITWGEGDY